MSAVPEEFLRRPIPLTVPDLHRMKSLFQSATTDQQYWAAVAEYDTVNAEFRKTARAAVNAVTEHNSDAAEARDLAEDFLSACGGLQVAAILLVKDLLIGIIDSDKGQILSTAKDALVELAAVAAEKGASEIANSAAVQRATDAFLLEVRRAIQRISNRSSKHAQQVVRRFIGVLRVAGAVASIAASAALILLTTRSIAHDVYGYIPEIEEAQQQAFRRIFLKGDAPSVLNQPKVRHPPSGATLRRN